MKDRVKVLITGPSPKKFSGGIGVHVGGLLKVFSGNKDIILEHFKSTDAQYDRESWGKKIYRTLANLLPITMRIRANDVVHINSTFDNRSLIRDMFYCVISILLIKKDTILQFHGGDPKNVKVFTTALMTHFCLYMMKRCHKIVTLSHMQNNKLKKIYPSIETSVIPNYIEVKNITKKRPGSNGLSFLFLGRVAESKGIPTILESVEMLSKENISFQVNIYGNGPLKRWLEQEIIKRDLGDKLRYLGVVVGDEKERVLKNSDVMLLPTSHNEGFPYAILEAFNSEMPVIGTRKGAIPDIIEDGINGHLIPAKNPEFLFDAMKSLSMNPDLAMRMGKNAKDKLLKLYSHQIMEEKYAEFYRIERISK